MQFMDVSQPPCKEGYNCSWVCICFVVPLMSMCLFAAAGFNSSFRHVTFAAHAASSTASPAGSAPQPAGSVLPNGPSLGGFGASGGPLPQQASGAPALTLPVQATQMPQCCRTVATALLAVVNYAFDSVKCCKLMHHERQLV